MNSVQPVLLSGTLWLVPALPLVGLLTRKRARVAPAIALIALLLHLPRLITALPAAGALTLLDHVRTLVRIGPFEVPFDLALDTQAAIIAGSLLFLACIFVDDDPGPCRSIMLSGGLCMILSDGIIGMALGSMVCTWCLCHRINGGALHVSDIALVVLGALSYWGTGGNWANGDYVPDARARIIPVTTHTSAGEHGTALVTLTAYPGAVVTLDDTHTSIVGVAPFVNAPVPTGVHSFHVHAQAGDFFVNRVTVSPGQSIALVPIGSTQSFRQIADGLAIMVDARGSFVLLLVAGFVACALARIFAIAQLPTSPAPIMWIAALPITLAIRALPIAIASTWGTSMMLAAGAAFALGCAWQRPSQTTLLASQLGLALFAAGVDAWGALLLWVLAVATYAAFAHIPRAARSIPLFVAAGAIAHATSETILSPTIPIAIATLTVLLALAAFARIAHSAARLDASSDVVRAARSPSRILMWIADATRDIETWVTRATPRPPKP